jgi:hypothetical protein
VCHDRLAQAFLLNLPDTIGNCGKSVFNVAPLFTFVFLGRAPTTALSGA